MIGLRSTRTQICGQDMNEANHDTGGTVPSFLGFGAALAILVGAFEYTGGSLSGYRQDPDVDEVARKEFLRKNRRRPIEETIAVLGEGRGVYGPGYEERRRQRIKENYGIDVPPSNTPAY